jgi:hypothetical protein
MDLSLLPPILGLSVFLYICWHLLYTAWLLSHPERIGADRLYTAPKLLLYWLLPPVAWLWVSKARSLARGRNAKGARSYAAACTFLYTFINILISDLAFAFDPRSASPIAILLLYGVWSIFWFCFPLGLTLGCYRLRRSTHTVSTETGDAA